MGLFNLKFLSGRNIACVGAFAFGRHHLPRSQARKHSVGLGGPHKAN